MKEKLQFIGKIMKTLVAVIILILNPIVFFMVLKPSPEIPENYDKSYDKSYYITRYRDSGISIPFCKIYPIIRYEKFETREEFEAEKAKEEQKLKDLEQKVEQCFQELRKLKEEYCKSINSKSYDEFIMCKELENEKTI